MVSDIILTVLHSSQNFLRTRNSESLSKHDIEIFHKSILEKPDAIINEIQLLLVDIKTANRTSLITKIKESITGILLKYISPLIVEWAQKSKLYFRAKKDLSLIDTYVNSFNPKGEDIFHIAKKSISERLEPSGLLPSKNSPLREGKLTSQFRTLATGTWKVLEGANGGSDPLIRLRKYADYNELCKAYLLDILQIPNSNTWDEVINNYKNSNQYRIVDFMNLDNKTFSELICYEIEFSTSHYVHNYFGESRSTLGNFYQFDSANIIEFLANLRLAHRSIHQKRKKFCFI